MGSSLKVWIAFLKAKFPLVSSGAFSFPWEIILLLLLLPPPKRQPIDKNHDAIVEATIKQTRQSVAKTKARINTLRQQLNAYESQLKEAQEQFALWTERAAKLADTDQAKALQCVARLLRQFR